MGSRWNHLAELALPSRRTGAKGLVTKVPTRTLETGHYGFVTRLGVRLMVLNKEPA